MDSSSFISFFRKKILYIFLILSISASAQSQKFDSIVRVVDEISFYQGTKAQVLIDELYQISHQSTDSLRLTAQYLCKEAKWHVDQWKTDTSLIRRIEHQLFLLENTGFLHEKAMLQYSLGLCHYSGGQYSDAFIMGLEALDQFKSLKDSIYVVRTLHLLGNTCRTINVMELGYDYFSEELKWVQKGSLDYFKARYSQYLMHLDEWGPGNLIDSVTNLIQSAKRTLNDEQLVTTYSMLGILYARNDEFDSAYHYFMKEQQIMDHIDNKELQAALYSNLGAFMNLRKDYKESIRYFTMAWQLHEKENLSGDRQNTYSGLSASFEALGEKDSALFYLKKYKQAIQQTINGFRAIEVYRQYILSYLKSTQDQLIISEQNIKLKNRQLLIITTTSLLGVSILLLFMLLMRQKKRRKEAENRELSERLKVEALEKEKMLLEQQQQQEIIDAKERELAMQSLLLSEKNQLLQQILEAHHKISKENAEIQQNLQSINEIIAKNINMDEAWRNFKLHFEKVHPHFFERLKQYCSDLTEENLKVCAYLRIGLSGKQIGQILNITTQSVYNHTHRLRKRLNVPDDADLESFIKSI